MRYINNGLRCILLTGVLAVMGTAAFSQTQGARAGEDFGELYLQAKERELGASSRAAQAVGAGPTSTAVYNLLRDKGKLSQVPVRGRDSGQKDRIRDALSKTVAYYLTSIGQRPDEINRLERSGLDPLAAGVRLVTSVPTLEDSLTVSPIAVVAEVSGNVSAGSETRPNVTFTVRRTLKGSPPTTFSLQLPAPAPLSDATAGEQYLLFLSAERGAFQRAAGRPDPGPMALTSAPYRYSSGTYAPTTPDQAAQTTSSSELDAFVARHPTILVPTYVCDPKRLTWVT